MSMFPIASQKLSSTVSSVTFSSIPSTFTHLQVRMFAYQNQGWSLMTFNGDTTNTNYATHWLEGSGSGAGSGDIVAGGLNGIGFDYTQSNSSSVFDVAIVDVLDYTNGNKYKTVKCIRGCDTNGAGYVGINSGVWLSTAGITSITLTSTTGGFQNNSTFQLYGIQTA